MDMLKTYLIIYIQSLFVSSSIPLFAQGDGTPSKKKLFQEDNISTSAVEYAITFSAEGDELYFTRSNGKWGQGNMKSTIYRSAKSEGKWSKPEVAEFSGRYDDSEPHLTADGKNLYFISSRPSGGVETSPDIWRMQRLDNNTWGDPQRLPEPINSAGTEYSPKTDHQGNLYFASDREGGLGQGDLYMAKWLGGHFEKPQNLGPTINSTLGEWNLEINSAGNILIFEASERETNLTGYGDLYISFLKAGTWTDPRHLSEINTTGSDLYPELYGNEKTLYFSSSDSLKSTDTNIYYVDFEAIKSSYRRRKN